MPFREAGRTSAAGGRCIPFQCVTVTIVADEESANNRKKGGGMRPQVSGHDEELDVADIRAGGTCLEQGTNSLEEVVGVVAGKIVGRIDAF